MSSECLKKITIVGGGLAGLTLGIRLRQNGIPVTILEAGIYPRHRVCGEFISGNGLGVLERAGLVPRLREAGAVTARTIAFFPMGSEGIKKNLPEPALCLSRFRLDAVLAESFRALGGQLTEHSRWKQSLDGEGTVRATGRRIESGETGWRWFGLKIHGRGIVLGADLEMHLSKIGYVGLCRLSDGETNVCGLFRSKTPVPDLLRNWRQWLAASPRLVHTLAQADFDQDSLACVAGLSLRPHRAENLPECCIGDSLTMTPPVTGNGMSMAFESAELALHPLMDFSREKIGWAECRERIAGGCDDAFRSRLKWAAILQWGLFQPLAAPLLTTSLGLLPRVWLQFFFRTR